MDYFIVGRMEDSRKYRPSAHSECSTREMDEQMMAPVEPCIIKRERAFRGMTLSGEGLK